MWMKENQLQVNSTGLWIKTSDDKVDLWRGRLTDILKVYGYKLLRSVPLKDSYHLSFQLGSEALILNTFRDGHIQLSTTEVAKMIETIIPHLEMKLGVKFDGKCLHPTEKYTKDVHKPYVTEYLAKREELVSPPPRATVRRKSVVIDEPVRRKSVIEDEIERRKSVRADLAEERRKSVVADEMERRKSVIAGLAEERRKSVIADEMERRKSVIADEMERRKSFGVDERDLSSIHPSVRANEIKNHYMKIQDDLVKARKRLNSTQDELAVVKKELTNLSEDLTDFKEKRVEVYRRFRYEKYNPLIYDYKYDNEYFQKYLERKKSETVRKISMKWMNKTLENKSLENKSLENKNE